MFATLSKGYLFAVVFFAFAALSLAQDASNRIPGNKDDGQKDEPKSFTELMAKQRIEQAKKDYEEMLKRADSALLLTEQLGNSYEKTGSVSRQKLDEVEKMVVKIRKELGAEGDEDETDADGPQPSTIGDALKYLQKTTAALADQLKKSTRFTISAAAIQSSNGILKVVRFLRLRK